MINLTTYEQRSLQFEVDIQGIEYNLLEGFLRFVIDDVEYGFPAKISSENITVDILPLQEVIKKRLKNNEVVQCKLEVFGDGFYLNPWNGEFKLEAAAPKLDNTGVKSIKITAEPIQIVKEEKLDIPEKSPEAKKREIVIDDEDHDIVPPFQEKNNTKKVHAKVKEKLEAMLGIRKKLKVKESTKPIKKKAKIIERKTKKDIAVQKKDSKLLMESFGMKNPRIQELMLAKAEEKAGDDPEAIFDVLERMLNPKIDDTVNQFSEQK